LLGAAAGGGLPQWNCGCRNCCDARFEKIPPLTQSSVAVQDVSGDWFLINASPDLASQIRASPDLQPATGTLRGSPISGVFLTNADLDHVLGLWSLREGEKLHIHATGTVRRTLEESLNLTAIMESFCGLVWHEPSETAFTPVLRPNGEQSSLVYRAIKLPGNSPLFDRTRYPDGTHSIAYYIMDRNTHGRLLVAPDVAKCNEALTGAMREADAVLFDGTFWSEDELVRIKTKGRTASEMGHITIKDSSLSLLGSLPAPRKIYIHVNNTNPVLCPHSPERIAVDAAGILVGHDGLEFDL
jgi:pyrroloquinoline quinone biosynthesis protein B